MKKLLFSVTIKDFDTETFTSGGPGGQNQNRVRSGVRLRHRPSGAVAESRETRDQRENKKRAFLKITQDSRFLAWHKKECARLLGQKSVEEIVDELMRPENIKLELKDDEGRWYDAENQK